MLSAFRRTPAREAELLRAPISTDSIGSELRCFAIEGAKVWTSSSVRALARKLGRVTLRPQSFAEVLSFGLVLDDRTLCEEIRSIPPHSTLHPDGRVETHAAPRLARSLDDAGAAVQALRSLLERIVSEEEGAHDAHLVGFTGGKDSRILAALPKRDPVRWQWLSVSGRDDAEHVASGEYARKLGLANWRWLEWTSDFLDGRIRRSAELANGLGAISDFTLLRGAFEPVERPARSALWQGTLADGLFAATYLPEARSLRQALTPRTAHLFAALSPAALEAFRASEPSLDRDPYGDAFWLRLFTKGRAYVCRALACLDDVSPVQLNPYLHPDAIALALQLSERLLRSDAIRNGLLGRGLDGPSAFGYRPPRYADSVFRTLQAEAMHCEALPALMHESLVASMRAGTFPPLEPQIAQSGPAYRSHAQPVPNLRDYEHVLTCAAFLNLLLEDGVRLLY